MERVFAETERPIPRVSIGMPVYNGEKYLSVALESLLSQTFSDYELIISDNDSTDATETICRAFASRDGRIAYVRQPGNQDAMFGFYYILHQTILPYFISGNSDY